MVDIRSNDARIVTQGHVLSHNIGSIGEVHGGLHYQGTGHNQDSEVEKAEGWLTSISPDFVASHETARDLQSPGTGLWFLESANFQRWFNDEVQHLECIGIPGSGKTIMSSIVIDYLEKTSIGGQSLVLFAYIRDDQCSMHTLQHFICALLLQVIKKQCSASGAILALRQDKPELPPLRRMLEVFQAVLSLSPYQKVFIVVDALDEWKSSDSFPDIADNLIFELERLHHAKLLVTSRYSIPFSSEAAYASESIDAKPEDIETFIHDRIRRGLLRKVRMSEELRDEITSKVQKLASGMFIIARLFMDRISQCRTPYALKNELETIPTNLGEFYLDTLRRIRRQAPQDADFASMLFAWMIYPKERLTAEEIMHGIAASSESLCMNLADGIVDERCLLAIAGGLVVIKEEERQYPRFGKAPFFVFVHFTVKEFLVERATEYLPRAENRLAEACLRYLSFTLPLLPPETSSRMVKEFWLSPETFNPYCLFHYAAAFWHYHACVDGDHINHLLAFDLYQQPLSPHMGYDITEFPAIVPYRNMAPEVYLTLLLSSTGKICMLRERISDKLLNFSDSYGLSPIIRASIGGHTEIIQLLLDRGVEIDRAAQDGMTPLSCASEDGRADAVHLLLERGAEIDRASKDGRTPLSYAAEEGQVDVMRLLIDKGAEIDRASKDGRTSLSYAAERGQVDAMCLLIDKGAEIDRVSQDGRTPLSYAAGSISEALDTTRLLIDRGAEIDRASKNGRTPLSYAAERGQVDVMCLLMDKGAEIERASQDGRTPLSYAAEYGLLYAMRFLIDKGAEIDRASKNGRTPLSYAAERGRVDVMRLLMDKGAEIERASQDGRTPLFYAAGSIYGAPDKTRLLIDRGAEIDRASQDGRTPLSYAAEYGSLDVMRFLIDKGAEIERASQDGRTPLSYAAKYGSLDVMRLLIDNGAEIERASQDGRTPLSYAEGRAWNREEAIRLLTDRAAQNNNDNVESAQGWS